MKIKDDGEWPCLLVNLRRIEIESNVCERNAQLKWFGAYICCHDRIFKLAGLICYIGINIYLIYVLMFDFYEFLNMIKQFKNIKLCSRILFNTNIIKIVCQSLTSDLFSNILSFFLT